MTVIREARLSIVPPGRGTGVGLPGNELPVYYRKSLRDKEQTSYRVMDQFFGMGQTQRFLKLIK